MVLLSNAGLLFALCARGTSESDVPNGSGGGAPCACMLSGAAPVATSVGADAAGLAAKCAPLEDVVAVDRTPVDAAQVPQQSILKMQESKDLEGNGPWRSEERGRRGHTG